MAGWGACEVDGGTLPGVVTVLAGLPSEPPKRTAAPICNGGTTTGTPW